MGRIKRDSNSGIYTVIDSIQEKILAYIWKNQDTFESYKDCVLPRYFTKSVHIDLCRIIRDYYERYDSSPSKVALEQESFNLCKGSNSKSETIQDYLDCLDRMDEMEFNDSKYLDEIIIKFGKRQAFVSAIVDTTDIVNKYDPTSKVEFDWNNIVKKFTTAFDTGENTFDFGMNYFDNYEERIYGYTQNEDVIDRFKTGINLLDEKLNGGVGRGEMFVVLAPPGRGKTSFLINIGATTLREDKMVIHFSLENDEKQIMRNYDQRIMGKSLDYIKEHAEDVIQAIGRTRKYCKNGLLLVKKYPTKGVTVDTLKSFIRRAEDHFNRKADVVIVDYGAILKPKSNFSDKRNVIEGNYEDLRAMADELSVCVATGAQGNRSSLSKKVVTTEDLAECFAIANTADIIVALCQTIAEKQAGKIRGYLAKVRDSADGILLDGTIDYETKKIEFNQDISQTMAEEEDDDNDVDDGFKSRYTGRRKKKKKSDDDYENS